VVCNVIKEEKKEIDEFIQLNPKIQKKEDRFKSEGSKPSYLKIKFIR